MTPDQFDVIAKLLRSRSRARAAARLVLLDGLRNVDAANAAGTTPQVASDAVQRFRKAERLIAGAWSRKRTPNSTNWGSPR